MKVLVDGDAAGGWIVEVSDDEHRGVYSPDAPRPVDASNASDSETGT
jgi:hypothetical protein